MTTLQDCCAPRDSMIRRAGEPVAHRRRPGTVAKLWRSTTQVAHRDVLARLLQARIQAAIADSSACRGAYVLQRPTERGEVETLVLALYEGARLGDGGACGGDLLALCDAEKHLLLVADESTVRYDVLTDPGRMRLYADLSRRFPLRMMVPR